MFNSPNDSHGSFAACQFNHPAGYSMYLNGITNGETFNGCHAFEGTIYFKNCSGVNWNGGIVDAEILIQGGTRGNFTNVGFQSNYWNRANGIGHNYNGQTSHMLFSGNYFMKETGTDDHILNN